LVRETVEANPQVWRHANLPKAGRVDLFLRAGPAPVNRAHIEVDLRRMLGRVVSE
jgi:hypothetical protein